MNNPFWGDPDSNTDLDPMHKHAVDVCSLSLIVSLL